MDIFFYIWYNLSKVRKIKEAVMLKEKVVVNSEIGLNARVASMFLRNSVKFNSDIILI